MEPHVDRIYLFIECTDYSRLRDFEDCDGYQDLPSVREDVRSLIEQFRKFDGVDDDNLIHLVNPTFDELESTIQQINSRMAAATAGGGYGPALFCYYGGHGSMYMYTLAVLNGNLMYPLED